ncbi:MAG: tyrosine-type recombinase/integrase [Erysipelotrichaceae bacterium]
MRSIFAQEITDYLNSVKNAYSDSSYNHFRCYLKRFDEWLYTSKIDNKNLNRDIIQNYTKTITGEHLTINEHLDSIIKFLKYLISLGYNEYIPEKMKNTSSYIPYYFSDEDVSNIFEICDNLSSRNVLRINNKLENMEIPMLTRIMYGTGSRLTETVSLRVKDVDFEKKAIYFTHDTKKKKQRIVPVHESLFEILEQYIEAMGLNCQPDSYLFPLATNSSAHIVSKTLSDYFSKVILSDIRKRQNLSKHQRGACIHQFRHSFALRSFRQFELSGNSSKNLVPILSLYLGHDSLNETEKYLRFSYLLYPEANEKMCELTDDIFPEVNFDE